MERNTAKNLGKMNLTFMISSFLLNKSHLVYRNALSIGPRRW